MIKAKLKEEKKGQTREKNNNWNFYKCNFFSGLIITTLTKKKI